MLCTHLCLHIEMFAGVFLGVCACIGIPDIYAPLEFLLVVFVKNEDGQLFSLG